MSRSREIRILGCWAFWALVASCTGPNVEIFNREVTASETTRSLTSSTVLERHNRATLRDEDLLGLYRRDPDAAISALAARYKRQPSNERLLALAEISSDHADSIKGDAPLAAMGLYLDAASLTQKGAHAAVAQGVKSEERTLYASSSARIALLMQDHPELIDRPVKVAGSFHPWSISAGTGKDRVRPDAYDFIVPARWLKTDGIKWKSTTQDGIGSAIIGHRKSTPERKKPIR